MSKSADKRDVSKGSAPFPIHSFITEEKEKKKKENSLSIHYQFGTCIPRGEHVNSQLGKEKTKLPKKLFLLLRQLYCTLHLTKYAVLFCTYQQLRLQHDDVKTLRSESWSLTVFRDLALLWRTGRRRL